MHEQEKQNLPLQSTDKPKTSFQLQKNEGPIHEYANTCMHYVATPHKAKSAGSLLNAYLNASSSKTHGVNFAVAGSTVLPVEFLADKGVIAPVSIQPAIAPKEISLHGGEIGAIEELQEEHTNVTIVYGDYYNAYKWILRRAALLGFDHKSLQKACCGGGGDYDFSLARMCGAQCTDSVFLLMKLPSSTEIQGSHFSFKTKFVRTYLNEATWNWHLMKTTMTMCCVYDKEQNYIAFDELAPEDSQPVTFLKRVIPDYA
ncbi:hypothetical protein GH714_011151 [Hevea brasiliensis]|uniref:Uncharacterized protein n=1 Tax=Hevea brasiliensis TaxID=3981 RepID=A0A6A6MX72_HEVBR|nr:hypothetical protein GH714_011151 [Hevea brasiliensis]